MWIGRWQTRPPSTSSSRVSQLVVLVELWHGHRVEDRPATSPSQEQLDEIAVAHLPWNDGVLPTVRVMEEAAFSGRLGAAGTVPR